LRLPAQNLHLENSHLKDFYTIQEQLSEGLSPARKQEAEIISDNTAKFFLLAIGRSSEQKDIIFEQAKLYLQMELQKLEVNIDIEQKNLEKSKLFKFSHPPIWTLQDEVDFLVEQVNKNKYKLPLFTTKDFKEMHDTLLSIMLDGHSQKPSHLLTLTLLEKFSKEDFLVGDLFEQGKTIYSGEKKRLLSEVNNFIQGGQLKFKDKKLLLLSRPS